MASLKEKMDYASEMLSESTLKVDVLAKDVKIGDTYVWSGFYGISKITILGWRDTKSRRFFKEEKVFTDKETGKETKSIVEMTGGLGFSSYYFL